MSFADLKRSSSSSFEKLTKELAKQNTTYSDPDEGKYWKPTVDKAGNGYAVIRFLPALSDSRHLLLILLELC